LSYFAVARPARFSFRVAVSRALAFFAFNPKIRILRKLREQKTLKKADF